jgi:hypothetical protein
MHTLPFSDNLDVRILEQLLDYDKTVASYKLFWFNGIFQEIIRGNKEITFRRIVCRMISASWYPLVQYHLNFGPFDKLYDTVMFIQSKYKLDSDVKEEVLLDFLDNLINPDMESKIKNFYNMVPYRLISPFFSDALTGLQDSKKNRIITELSQTRENTLYKILDKEKKIIVSENWFDYIYKNQSIIYGWMNYKLTYFLQKKNPNVPAIPLKLHPPYQRNLSAAKKLWESLARDIEIKDIYTDKVFSEENMEKHGVLSIEHFIPWSFVLHDELWNLIPTFKDINASKSNKLPNLEVYLNRFCEEQYKAFMYFRKDKSAKKQLEDYLNINKKFEFTSIVKASVNVSKETFFDSLKDTLMPLHQIAYNQGYEIWHNNLL